MRLFFSLTIMLLVGTVQAQLAFTSHTIMANINTSEEVAAITNADLDGDGDLDLLMADAQSVKWYENVDGQHSTMIKHVLLEEDCKFLFATDMDGDGDMDVIAGSNTQIFTIQNAGSGTFDESELVFSTAAYSYHFKSIVPVDIDTDGDIDIIYAIETPTQNNWPLGWLEKTEGSENYLDHVIDPDSKVLSIGYLNMDGDAHLDLVVSSYRYGSTDILLYVNDGFNNFTSQFIAENITWRRQLYIFDMDGDGYDDVVTTKQIGGEIIWYRNLENTGEFILQDLVNSGAYSIADLKFQDLDGDGNNDLAFASFEDDQVGFMKNTGASGVFDAPVIVNTNANGANTITLYDFDNDSDVDILSGSFNDDKIAWYENIDGLANFSNEHVITSSINVPQVVRLADFDGDGDLDAVCYSRFDDKLAWYENEDGQGNFGAQRVIYTDSRSVKALKVADIDGDGDMDIVSGDYSSNSSDELIWFENANGQGNFIPHILNSFLASIPDICLKDLDSDGDIDILFSQSGSFGIFWYPNTGDGSFGEMLTINTSYGIPVVIKSADMNGDSHMDVVTIGSDGHTTWYPNDGSNNFGNQILIATPSTDADHMTIADMDSDGDVDIVLGNSINSNGQIGLVWMENTDGLGNFGPGQTITTNLYHLNSIEIVDIDSDGDPDVICGADNGIKIFANTDGQGSFSYLVPVTVNDFDLNYIESGDINGDGNIDILSALSNGSPIYTDSDTILWYENSGLLENKIEGVIRMDLESDGCLSSDNPMNGLLVVADNGEDSYGTFTAADGTYRIFTDTGTYSTAIAGALPAYYSSNPATHTAVFTETGNTESANFCIVPNQVVNDVNIIFLPLSEARPGFSAQYQLVYKNGGTTVLSGDITLSYNGSKLSYLSSSQAPENESSGLLTFSYADLNPFEVQTIDLLFEVLPPPVNNLDDILSFVATIGPISDDPTVSDNTSEYDQIVINAFDPNDITCLQGDQIEIENAGDYLQYLIRFQNTGTASAVRVRVANILDDKLDWNTLEPISSSHSNTVEILNGNEVSFIFNAIYLPDSVSDEPNSHGFIAYRIKPRSNVIVGDIIYNTASIYFDYNLPVVTNTATTEIIDNINAVQDLTSSLFSVYPVPTSEFLYVKTETLIQIIDVYNQLGQKLRSYQNTDVIDVSDLNPGLYMIRVKDISGYVGIRKFVKI